MSVDFDPVKIGPRPRRIDPVRAVVLTVVVGLAIAIVKPWASPTSDHPATSVAAVPPTSSPSAPTPTSTAPIARPAVSTGPPPPTWDDVAPVIEAHDAWGVRAILVARRQNVGSGADPRFVERWSRTSPDSSTVEIARVARDDDQAIVAVGITFPTEIEPLDARIWRLHANDETEWIAARPLHATDRAGSFTFVRSDRAGGAPSWAAGQYRVDLLAADQLYSIAVQIPERSGSVPAPDEWPATQANLVGPEESDPSGVRIGPFATVDGVGMPLSARPHELMSQEEAWRQNIGGPGGFVGSDVATAYLPRATGLGVMLTPHADVRLAIVRRIAPDARFHAAPMLGGISAFRGGQPYIAFAPRAGGAWPPGVYAITVRWSDGEGLHDRTWHVEFRPGPPASSIAVR